MCSIVEEYADKKAINTAIESFVYLKQTLETTIAYVVGKFPNASKEYITEKYNELKNN